MPSESKDAEDKPKSRLRPKVVLLNASKREAFSPNSGFKRLFRRLRSSNYKPVNNRDDITAICISLHVTSRTQTLVFGHPLSSPVPWYSKTFLL